MIGAGKISEVHLEALSRNPEIELVSICDLNLEKARSQAIRFNITKVFSNWLDLFNHDNIDAVDIVLPTYLHSTVILEALKRKKHVICEKPLAISQQELITIEELTKKSKCNVHLKQYLRYSKIHKLVAELITKGTIGDVYMAIGKFSAKFSQLMTDKQNWRANPAMSGGGVLMEIGVHCIDYFNSILGEPKSVFGLMRGEPVETVSQTIVEYNDSVATFICDWTSQSQGNWWTKQIFGTKGSINIIDNKKESIKLEIFDEIGNVRIVEEKDWWREANITAINEIVKRIRENNLPLASINEAKSSLAIIQGAYNSFKEKKKVVL